MSFDSDVALVGTGLAPLIAASHLLSLGKSVLILNPDFDFFLENSELPLDPLLPVGRATLETGRIAESLPDAALSELRPFFPGPVEFWSEGADTAGYHDAQAPHVRSRERLWVSSGNGGSGGERSNEGLPERHWEDLVEEFYVRASDDGLNPQLLEGIPASSRFPGISLPRDRDRGLLVPRLCDVDVSRYRNGVLEFARERLGPRRVINEASQIELMPGGVRFRWQGSARTARLREGMLVFWTPRLTSWILGQAKVFETRPAVMPAGIRLWEQWSLVSRDKLDPGVVGLFNGDLAVWAEIEGMPAHGDLQQLSVLRLGELVSEVMGVRRREVGWASHETFDALSNLCHGFLRWDRFSVRAMTPRAILEWDAPAGLWDLKGTPESADPSDRVRVVTGCDGPIQGVVRASRVSCERVYGGA